MSNPCHIWDLFCGGSGAGTGVLRGLGRLGYSPKCIGVNHNRHAVATSRRNHPEHIFLCTGVDAVTPGRLFKRGDVLLGWGSPECIYHSVARGGTPINDQERSTAYCVWRWAHQTQPIHILIENVPEFEWWGRLMQKRKNGRLVWKRQVFRKGRWRRVETTDVPIHQWSRTWEQYLRDLARWGWTPCMVKDPAYKGEDFQKWVARGRALGYIIDWRVLNAADYGDPTSRRRLFVQAVRADSGRKIVWPSPTHAKPDKEGRVPEGRLPWRTAREILDLDDYGPSVFERKRPLSDKTLRRIRIGLLKYGLADFILPPQGFGDRTRSTGQPLQTVKANDRGIGLVQPQAFMLPGFGEREGQEPRTHSIDTAAPAITSQGHLHLAQPLLITMEHGGSVKDASRAPLPTITTAKGGAMGVAQSFIVPKEGVMRNNQPQSLDKPLGTVLADPGQHKLATAFIMPQQAGGKAVKSIDEPISTLTSTGAEALITSEFLVQVAHGNDRAGDDNRRAKATNAPLPGLTGSPEFALASALVKLKGTGTANSPDQPLGTVGASGGHHALMSSVVKFYGTGTAKPTTEPVDTLTAKERMALVQPVISNAILQTAHSGADAARVKSPGEPLPPVAGNRGDAAVVTFQVPSSDGRAMRDAVLHLNGLFPGGTGRPVLVVGEDRYEIEIYFRMLKVNELARAQSFPEGYHFCGTKTDAVKQIGNAVPGCLAEALTIAAISQSPDIRPWLERQAA